MEWISVKDRLPEEGIRVLSINISDSYEPYKIDYIVKFDEFSEEPYIWACRLCDEWRKVTHWMPLPLPPKN